MQKRNVICFEGISGSGKSHQISKLSVLLGGNCVIPEFVKHPLFRERFINNEPLPRLVDALNVAQQQYFEGVMDKKVVLMDRGIYTLMTLVEPEDKLPQVTIRPNIYIILDCSVDTAMSRIALRERKQSTDILFEKYRTELVLRQARNNYLKLAQEMPNTHLLNVEQDTKGVSEYLWRLL